MNIINFVCKFSDITYFDGVLPAGSSVFKWLDRIDVYLQPSFGEGLPRALIEAMSRGCPAIASSVAGNLELLESECLHRPGDVQGLSNRILRAATDRIWRIHHAKRNWQEACNYSSDILVPRRNEFWECFAKTTRT